MKARKVFVLLFAIATAVIFQACSNQNNVEDVVQNTTSESMESESQKEKEEREIEEPLNLDEYNVVTNKVTKPDFGTLSDNIYSFQVEIYGELYQFPMKYTDFISYGWEYEKDAAGKLPSNYMRFGIFDNGKFECSAYIVNFDVNAQPISECYISGIYIGSVKTRDIKDFSLRLPKGLEFGKASLEEIKEAYGTPGDTYENEYNTQLTYGYNFYQEVEIDVSKDVGSITAVSIKNIMIPDDFVASEVEIDAEVPESVKNYKAPDKPGDSLETFIVQYDGIPYQLPAPVSTFVTNGWQVNESGTDMVLLGHSTGHCTLVKDHQELRVMVTNYSERATSIENCFTTVVNSGNSVDVVIPHNITMGMSESDLEKALKGIKYKEDTSSIGYKYYTVVPGKTISNYYEIIVGDNAICKIVVQTYSDY